MESLIVHADLDTFYVSVQRLLDPTLVGRPVIVGGDPHGRGIVAACSYEPRAFGVRSGMTARDAYRLCPQAVFVRVHGEYYGYYSRLVKNILQGFAPDVAPMTPEAAGSGRYTARFPGSGGPAAATLRRPRPPTEHPSPCPPYPTHLGRRTAWTPPTE